MSLKKLSILFLTMYYVLSTMYCLWAAGPNSISYQGRLRETGQPANGNRSMEFKIYTDPTAAGAVWTSQAMTVFVSSGMYSTQITGAGLKDLDFENQDYYVEANIGGVPFLPREKFSAIPYAIKASTATNLFGTGNLRLSDSSGNHWIGGGNLGVGVTNPSAMLNVKSIDSIAVAFKVDTAGIFNSQFKVSTAGYVSIGGLSGFDARLDVYESGMLGSSGGNSQIVARIGGNVGNHFMNNIWFYRDAAGSDWITARLHDGISIDSSYLTPGSNTKTWWERDPQNNIQSWGNGGSAYLTINGGKVGIGTTDPITKFAINDSSVTTVGTKGFMLRNNSTNDYVGIWNYDSNKYAIESADEVTYRDLLLQPHAGNVGIGVTNPGATLDVNGTVDFGSANTTYYAPVAGEPSMGTLHYLSSNNGWLISSIPATATWQQINCSSLVPLGTKAVYIFVLPGDAGYMLGWSDPIDPALNFKTMIGSNGAPTNAMVPLNSSRSFYWRSWGGGATGGTPNGGTSGTGNIYIVIKGYFL